MKMKMPKTGGKPAKPHARLRKLKAIATTAFPSGSTAFPSQGDASIPGGGPMMPPTGAAPGQAMNAPSTGAAMGAAPGDVSQ